MRRIHTVQGKKESHDRNGRHASDYRYDKTRYDREFNVDSKASWAISLI